MKNIIITFILGMVLPICAMEKLICYLAHMSQDIQESILFFVKDDETDKEFIERTKNIQSIEENTYNHFLIHAEPTSSENDKSIHKERDILRSFCPDRHKLVLLVLSRNLEDTLMLTLVDYQKEQMLCGEELEGGDYKYISLSRGANIIAAVECRVPPECNKPCYGPIKNILMIKNLVTKKKGEYDISDMYDIHSLAFNKQGTRVIVHGAIEDGLDIRPIHKIFSVKDVIQKPDVLTHNDKNEKIDTVIPIKMIKEPEELFQIYLRERRVCKSIEYNK